MDSLFKLLVAAIAAFLIIALIAGMYIFPFGDPIAAIKEKLNSAELREGKLVEGTTLKFNAGAAFQGETFDTANRSVNFKCTLGELCDDESRFEFDERKVGIEQIVPVNVSTRCKYENNIFACTVYFGKEPAQLDNLDMNFVENENAKFNAAEKRFDANANSEIFIKYSFGNTGDLNAADINAFVDYYLFDAEDKITKISSKILGIGDLNSGGKKDGRFKLTAPSVEGKYKIKFRFEGDDTGYADYELDFFIKPRACIADKCTEPEWLGEKCTTHCRCRECVFGFVCKASTLSVSNEKLKLAPEIILNEDKSRVRGSNAVDFEVDDSICKTLEEQDPRLEFQNVPDEWLAGSAEVPSEEINAPQETETPEEKPVESNGEYKILTNHYICDYWNCLASYLGAYGKVEWLDREGTDFSQYNEIWVLDLGNGSDLTRQLLKDPQKLAEFTDKLFEYYKNGGNILVSAEGTSYYDYFTADPEDSSLYVCDPERHSGFNCSAMMDVSRQLASKFGITINTATMGWPHSIRFVKEVNEYTMIACLHLDELGVDNIPDPNHPIIKGVLRRASTLSDAKIENYEGKPNITPVLIDEFGNAAILAVHEPGKGKIIFDSSWYNYATHYCRSVLNAEIMDNIHNWFTSAEEETEGSSSTEAPAENENNETQIAPPSSGKIYRDAANAKIVYDAANNKIIANLYKFDSGHLLTGIKVGLEIKNRGGEEIEIEVSDETEVTETPAGEVSEETTAEDEVAEPQEEEGEVWYVPEQYPPLPETISGGKTLELNVQLYGPDTDACYIGLSNYFENVDCLKYSPNMDFSKYSQIWVIDSKQDFDLEMDSAERERFANKLMEYYENGGNVLITAEGKDYYRKAGDPLYDGDTLNRAISRELAKKFGITINITTVAWPAYLLEVINGQEQMEGGGRIRTFLQPKNVHNPEHPIIKGVTSWGTTGSDSAIQDYEGKPYVTPIVFDDVGNPAMVAVHEPGKGKIIFDASWFKFHNLSGERVRLAININNWFKSSSDSTVYTKNIEDSTKFEIYFQEETEANNNFIWLTPSEIDEENFMVEFSGIDLDTGTYDIRVFVESYTPTEVNCNKPETSAVIVIGEDTRTQWQQDQENEGEEQGQNQEQGECLPVEEITNATVEGCAGIQVIEGDGMNIKAIEKASGVEMDWELIKNGVNKGRVKFAITPELNIYILNAGDKGIDIQIPDRQIFYDPSNESARMNTYATEHYYIPKCSYIVTRIKDVAPPSSEAQDCFVIGNIQTSINPPTGNVTLPKEINDLFVSDLHGFGTVNTADDIYEVYQNGKFLGKTDESNLVEDPKDLRGWDLRFETTEFEIDKSFVDSHWKKIDIDTSAGPVTVKCSEMVGGHCYVCVYGDKMTTEQGKYVMVGFCKLMTVGTESFEINFE